jgi:hypothetical protein
MTIISGGWYYRVRTNLIDPCATWSVSTTMFAPLNT